MKEELVSVIRGGRIYTSKVKGGTNFSESNQEHRWTVPANKRWHLLWGAAQPDSSATVNVVARDAANDAISYLANMGATTGFCAFPNATANGTLDYSTMEIFEAGEYIRVAFGAAQGASAYVFLRVIEEDV